MTDSTLFFDTDCISAFLWIDDTSIVIKLYGNRVAIPMQVYKELMACKGEASVIKARITELLNRKEAIIVDMEVDSEEYNLYTELAFGNGSETLMGRGEASCIALAKYRDGILASNNLKDVGKYIELYNLKHITTGDIIVEAYNKQMVTMEDAENMWSLMLRRRRKLGTATFAEYLSRSSNILSNDKID